MEDQGLLRHLSMPPKRVFTVALCCEYMLFITLTYARRQHLQDVGATAPYTGLHLVKPAGDMHSIVEGMITVSVGYNKPRLYVSSVLCHTALASCSCKVVRWAAAWH
jgi:hypothetical protein